MRDRSVDFGRIRRELDPAFSYLILEGHGDERNIEELMGILQRVGVPILETKVHETGGDERFFLVAKLEPEKCNEISKEYVSVNLPENVACLFYGSLISKKAAG